MVAHRAADLLLAFLFVGSALAFLRPRRPGMGKDAIGFEELGGVSVFQFT